MDAFLGRRGSQLGQRPNEDVQHLPPPGLGCHGDVRVLWVAGQCARWQDSHLHLDFAFPAHGFLWHEPRSELASAPFHVGHAVMVTGPLRTARGNRECPVAAFRPDGELSGERTMDISQNGNRDKGTEVAEHWQAGQ